MKFPATNVYKIWIFGVIYLGMNSFDIKLRVQITRKNQTGPSELEISFFFSLKKIVSVFF